MSTLAHALLARVRATPKAVAMHLATGEGWTSTTWTEGTVRVLALARWLRAAGVTRGERVAVLGEPDLRWIEADFATLLCGGATVGIYPTLLPEQVLWQLRHGEVRVLLGSSDLLARLPVDALNEAGILVAPWDVAHPALRPQVTLTPEDLAAVEAMAAEVQPSDACAILYTSGTTGEPKGVVLSHAAMLATARATQRAIPLEAGETSLIFLPLAHSLQRIVLYRGLLEEVEAWIVPRLDRVAEVLPLARPSVLATVPRMLEKVLARAEAAARSKGPRPLRIFTWAMDVAREVSVHLESQTPVPLGLRAKALVADRLVWTKVRARMGGRLKTIVCGGARLSPEVGRAFHGMGVATCEGWGLTETCAPATLNARDDLRFGTVGRPLPGIELRLEDDGEVLVRGDGLFSGYWRAPEATAAVLDAEGWFRTGDLGRMEDGRLVIVDRKKELLVTSGGKNIAPLPLEGALEGGVFGQVVVVGDDRPYLVALFAPDPEAARDLDTAALRDEAQRRVQALNARVPSFEQIKRFAVLDGPLTVESGLLTPTLKLRRRTIASTFAAEINTLYV